MTPRTSNTYGSPLLPWMGPVGTNTKMTCGWVGQAMMGSKRTIRPRLLASLSMRRMARSGSHRVKWPAPSSPQRCLSLTDFTPSSGKPTTMIGMDTASHSPVRVRPWSGGTADASSRGARSAPPGRGNGASSPPTPRPQHRGPPTERCRLGRPVLLGCLGRTRYRGRPPRVGHNRAPVPRRSAPTPRLGLSSYGDLAVTGNGRKTELPTGQRISLLHLLT